MEIFEYKFLENSTESWLYAIGVTLGLLILLYIVKKVLLSKVRVFSRKTTAIWDDALFSTLEKTGGIFLLFLSLYVGAQFLRLTPSVKKGLAHAIFLITLLQIGIWGVHLISDLIDRHIEKKREQDLASTTTLGLIRLIANVALFSLIFLVALNNLGVDITALVAGLGVGGIAIALAVQNILGDLFASLTIVLDKPFVVGDFIVVGDFAGSIEKIGLKTTRIRSISGEQLIFSNNDLLQSRLRNFKRMHQRRVVFRLGVIYQTPAETLERIPGMIREIIEKQKLARFDRSHFVSYGESSLDIETVYWVNTPEYNDYMDAHQAINMEIFRRFQKEDIEFAYPTQTTYFSKGAAGKEGKEPGAEDRAPMDL